MDDQIHPLNGEIHKRVNRVFIGLIEEYGDDHPFLCKAFAEYLKNARQGMRHTASFSPNNDDLLTLLMNYESDDESTE